MKSSVFILALPLFIAPLAYADSEPLESKVERLTGLVEELRETVRAQQNRIASLESARLPQAPLPLPPSAAPAPSAGGNLSGFNPEIGVLADIVGQLSESSEDGEGNDALTVREVELVFGHPIDPYSRLDVTIGFPELESVELEEAYITHWGLPEAKARLGRFLPKIGKALAIHRDSLDTADEPLVIQQYFGIEGMSSTGADLTGFLPLPWTALTHELTVGAAAGGMGEGGAFFGATRRRPSYYAHFKNFWDVSDAMSVELGATYLLGSKDADSKNEVNALGLDATLIHHVTPSNKLKWQTEAFLQDRDESFEIDADTETVTVFRDQPWGLYSLVDYRLSPRLGIGGRFDYVEPIDADPALLAREADTAWSGYLTLYQSEFARWRLQYRHTDFAQGGDDNTVFLQATAAIGVHRHQIQ